MNDADPSTPEGGEASADRSGTAGKRYRSLVGVAVLAVLALLATAGVKSYRDLEKVRNHERRLLSEIDAAKDRIRTLTKRIDRIENDPAMLERLAREELGMVREGDVVIVLPADEPAPLPASAPPDSN